MKKTKNQNKEAPPAIWSPHHAQCNSLFWAYIITDFQYPGMFIPSGTTIRDLRVSKLYPNLHPNSFIADIFVDVPSIVTE